MATKKRSTEKKQTNVTIEDGMLVIRLPIADDPPLSKSGKTRVVASTNGFIAPGATYDGEIVRVSINAIIPAD
jgi:hypothetical protein